jgi:hypothetical protein
MEFFKEQIHSFISRLDEKQVKKMELNTLINLIDKFNNIDDVEVEGSFNILNKLIVNIINEENPSYKEYKSNFNTLKKLVRKNYGFVKKGTLNEESIGVGVAIGVAIGAGLSSASNPAFMGVGIPIGIAIGAGIGSKREKEAEEKGLLY